MAEQRLIDANPLVKGMKGRLKSYEKEYGYLSDFVSGYEEAIDDVVDTPTVEAKPVVHCKDCKYNVANRQQDPLDITDYTDIVCDYFMTDGMEADDFCSKGVKIPVISMEDVPKIMKEMEK